MDLFGASLSALGVVSVERPIFLFVRLVAGDSSSEMPSRVAGVRIRPNEMIIIKMFCVKTTFVLGPNNRLELKNQLPCPCEYYAHSRIPQLAFAFGCRIARGSELVIARRPLSSRLEST